MNFTVSTKIYAEKFPNKLLKLSQDSDFIIKKNHQIVIYHEVIDKTDSNKFVSDSLLELIFSKGARDQIS